MAKRLTFFILVGMVLGILLGWALNTTIEDQDRLKEIAGYFAVVTDLFLRLIKMIIAPLVFSTLVVGIAHMGDTAALGRIGLRTILWFLAASLLSLTLGLILVNLFQPGSGLDLPLPEASAKAGVEAASINVKDFITHLVPRSMIEAMAGNEILQIVIFSVFMGVAVTAIGDKAAPLVKGIEALVAVMLQITDYVMRAAPIAVFAAIASSVATNGLGILTTFGKFVGGFYLGLALLWLLLAGLAYLIIGGRVRLLLRYIREPILLAFSTASSEAAYPRTLEALDRFGVPRRIASFVLPLGYSFNLDGSMLYCTFATMFIMQAHGVHLSVQQQIFMLLLLMVTSKGIAGVPRASLVVIMATLTYFGLPEAWIALVLGVDHLLDMGRSATNVIGNSVAAAVVGKWEKQLGDGEAAPVAAPPAASG